MPLFFILSGLGLFYKYLYKQSFNYFDELKSFAKRLLLPYVVWSAIYLLGTSLSALFVNKKPLLDTILERGYAFISFRGAAPIWFLAALFLADAIYVAIIRQEILKKRTILCHSIFCFFLLGLTGYAQDWFQVNKLLLSKIYLYPLITVFRLLPSLLYVEIGFLFGYIFEKILVMKLSIKIIIFTIIIVLFSFLKINFSCGMNMHTSDFNNIYLLLLLGLLGSLGHIVFCCLLPETMNYLAYIGKKSMDIMILHYPPIPTLRIVSIIILKLHINIYLSVTLITTFTIILCLLISIYLLQPVRKKIYGLPQLK